MRQVKLRDNAIIELTDENKQLKEVIAKQKEEIQMLKVINEKNAKYHKRINKIIEEGGVILTKEQLKGMIDGFPKLNKM